MPWTKTPAGTALIRWAVPVLVIIAVVLWLRFAPSEAPWGPRRILGAILPEPREIVRVERVEVPGPERIVTIRKEVVVEKYRDVGIPTPATVSDAQSEIVAVGEINTPSPEGGTAVAVLRTSPGPDNTSVGRVHIEYAPKPQKFIQLKRAFFVEGWYYLAGDYQAETSLGINPLRIGPVEIKAKAGVNLMRENSHIKGFVAIGGEIKF